MSLTVRDICNDADLFRAAYPNWPHPELGTVDEPAFRHDEEMFGPQDSDLTGEYDSRHAGGQTEAAMVLERPPQGRSPMTAQIREGDRVRVRRYRIAPDGTSEQVADWSGIALSARLEGGTLDGIELSGVGHLGVRDVSLGREGTGRTVVERITDESGKG